MLTQDQLASLMYHQRVERRTSTVRSRAEQVQSKTAAIAAAVGNGRLDTAQSYAMNLTRDVAELISDVSALAMLVDMKFLAAAVEGGGTPDGA